ncbi:hypothetical protein OsI_35721 [Oryza sativa Indica Group]|uniref:Protein FAR1-RELATED SEQUENCE n=1 Tax=Oryza sativa subsp. indica TaxID=39946 RepID=B8BJY1_ORYSI|nr:hypothetical protein OsI_35721 [Oryza sativa Indica Group]
MNNELKGYISVKYDILTFLEHFDRLLSDKRYEEVKNDFKTTQSTPWPKADLTILRQATRIYTPAIFKVFQEQVLQTLNCDLYYCGDIDAKMVYKLKVHGKHHEHVVKFSPTEGKVRCSCKKFEFLGILCCHALKILDVNNIKEIPKQYILQRWTIDAKSLHIKSNCITHEDPKIKLSTRRRDLCRMFVKIASRATESDETYLMAANNAQKLAEDVEKYLSIRPDQDLDKSGIEENVGPSKARGIKVKEKAIRGSRRPIGGFDKATQRSKKKKSDSNTSKCPVQAEVVTPSLPYTMM